MSIAKKCDICGKYYESYNTKNNSEKTNGLMFLTIDDRQQYHSHNVIDTCPECMDSIKAHIDNLNRAPIKV